PYYNSVISLGYVYHLQLYNIMQEMHIGLCSWLPHPFHIFFNPNKVFIYIHSGLLPVLTSSLKEPISYLKPYDIVIDNPLDELQEILMELYEDRKKIEETKCERKNYAMKNLTFDNFSYVLQKIYDAV
ncbi:MAG: hypothetical protein J7L07_08980, partial [Candidatus Odinarchaeota archaeon]|nr:hypothetical protein [Candidatus Odinarchaeota archaeon]